MKQFPAFLLLYSLVFSTVLSAVVISHQSNLGELDKVLSRRNYQVLQEPQSVQQVICHLFSEHNSGLPLQDSLGVLASLAMLAEEQLNENDSLYWQLFYAGQFSLLRSPNSARTLWLPVAYLSQLHTSRSLMIFYLSRNGSLVQFSAQNSNGTILIENDEQELNRLYEQNPVLLFFDESTNKFYNIVASQPADDKPNTWKVSQVPVTELVPQPNNMPNIPNQQVLFFGFDKPFVLVIIVAILGIHMGLWFFS